MLYSSPKSKNADISASKGVKRLGYTLIFNATMTLEALFEKTNYATDKLKHHSYIPVYDKLFGPIRNQVSNVLEIGIGSGGSLQLWHDYFLNARIYGIDRGYVREGLNRFDRIHQIISDAYTAECVEYFKTNDIQLDIIIDDGPHNKRSQMLAMELYFPLLSDNGIIIIDNVKSHGEMREN